VATLRWHRMTWEDLLAAVELYQREFSGRAEEDAAYLRCVRLLEGKPITARAAKSRDIVRFLNDWKCGVNKLATPPVLAEWIRAHAERLQALEARTIADADLPDALDEIAALYDSLWETARAQIRTWGPAANAKTLHQLNPGLFVMWDKNIVPFADGYADFIAEMHDLGARMIEHSPFESAGELERGLQAHLRYRVRKTLAKYLDEANWYLMVGADRVARGS
jgi:hypothetical protein